MKYIVDMPDGWEPGKCLIENLGKYKICPLGYCPKYISNKKDTGCPMPILLAKKAHEVEDTGGHIYIAGNIKPYLLYAVEED